MKSARTPADLRALENRDTLDRIAIALEQIAAAITGSRAPDTLPFSTEKCGPFPPGFTQKTWYRLAKTISGTYLAPPKCSGSAKGRIWITPRDAFDRWQTSNRPAPTTEPKPPVAEPRRPGPEEQQIARLVGGRAVGAVRR